MANPITSARDLARSMANFSWALSVFGISQSTKVALGLSTGDPGGEASKSFEEATKTIEKQFRALDQAVYKAGESATNAAVDLGFGFLGPGARPETPIPPGRTKPPPPVAEVPGPRAEAVGIPAASLFPAATRSDYTEEVFSVYNVGRGVFDQTTQYINLNLNMFDFQGRWTGVQTGVHVNTTPADKVAAVLLAPPQPPPQPIDAPPVPHVLRSEWTKGLFTFADGSAVYAQGPAWTRMVPLDKGDFMFMVTTSQVITRGTGLFEGVQGIKQGTGATYVAPGLVQEGKFPAPGFEFTAKVIDSFRLVRRGFLDVPAVGGREATQPVTQGGIS